jgi:stalled ribosome rescue protein Dom34
MVRIKQRWNQQSRPRSLAQLANAIAASVWKLSSNVVLNLENENFETETQGQRIDIMEEVVFYLVHIVDRRVYEQASQQQREVFISALVADLARMLEDSRVDVQGPGEYRADFVAKLNQRSAEYAGYGFSSDEGGSFSMRCKLGERVAAAMGERDRRWIPDYIVGREAPEIETALGRSLSGLVSFDSPGPG